MFVLLLIATVEYGVCFERVQKKVGVKTDARKVIKNEEEKAKLF